MRSRDEIIQMAKDLFPALTVKSCVYKELDYEVSLNTAAFDFVPAVANHIYFTEGIYAGGSPFLVAGGVPTINFYNLAAVLKRYSLGYYGGTFVSVNPLNIGPGFFSRFAWNSNGCTSVAIYSVFGGYYDLVVS